MPEFSEVAFKMYPGQVSNPVKSQFGWHIIKLEDKRQRPAPPFDAVKDQIEAYRGRKAQQRFRRPPAPEGQDRAHGCTGRHAAGHSAGDPAAAPQMQQQQQQGGQPQSETAPTPPAPAPAAPAAEGATPK